MAAWMEALDPEICAKAARLIRFLSEQGLGDAERWVRSEIEEDIPQVAGFLLIRTLWKAAIDIKHNSSDWIQGWIDEAEKNPRAPFADAGQALKRMVVSGVDRDDISRVARMVAYETVFAALYAIDFGEPEPLGNDEVPQGIPGWALMETDTGTDRLTGRRMGGLHESLLSLDPSGREGRPA